MRSRLRFVRLAWVLCTVGALLGCGDGDSTSSNPIPGDTCDASKPLACGALSSGSDTNQTVLYCNGGVYESIMDCRPTGQGQTNRCFEGANFTVIDCFDEPTEGQVTRCEITGDGAGTAYKCTVGQR
jgi:hypothetical protein